MPIPMSNQRKVVQAPQVARGEALNLTQEAQQASQIKAHQGDLLDASIRASVDTANEAFKIGNEFQDAAELQKLQDAYTTYSAGVTMENARVANMTNKEFLLDRKRKGGYDDTIQRLYAPMQKVIDETKNKKLATQFQNQINEINISNAQKLAIKTDSSRRQSQQTSADAAVDQIIQRGAADNLRFDAGVNAKNPGIALSEYKRLAAEIDKQLTLSMWAQGIRDHRAVDVAATKKNEDLAQQVINRMNQTNPSNVPWEESKPGTDFLQNLYENGYVSESFANKEFNRMESETVSEEVMFRPEQFVDQKTGEFKFSDRLKNAPHMTHYEYDRLIKNTESISKSIKGKAQNLWAQELLNAFSGDEADFKFNHGIQNGQTLSAVAKGLGITVEQLKKDPIYKSKYDAYIKDLKKHEKELRPDEMIDRAAYIEEYRNTPILVNTKTGEIVMKDLTPQQAKQYASDPSMKEQNYAVVRPLQNAKELVDTQQFYEDMADFLASGFDPKKTKYIGQTWEQASSAPASAVLYSEIWNTMREAEKVTGEIPISTLKDIYKTTAQMLSSGVELPSEYQINGKQISRVAYMDMSKEIDYRNKSNLETLREAFSIAIAKNLPHETSAAMLDAMNRRSLEMAEKQWNGKRDFAQGAWDNYYWDAAEALDKFRIGPRMPKLDAAMAPFKPLDALPGIYATGKTAWEWLFAEDANLPLQAQDVFEELYDPEGTFLTSGTFEENKKTVSELNNKKK